MRHLLLILAVSAPARADAPISAEAFDELTRGKTYHYSDGSGLYGAEQYLSGRRVLWSWLDGECEAGRWFEAGAGAICFVYEQEPEPQCWSFRLRGGRLVARYLNEGAPMVLYELEQSAEPLICPGPDIGV